MKTKRIMILLIILSVLLMVIPINAQTISMANPDNIGQRDIQVFYPNGSFVGLYNTTSVITINPNESYVFMLKPQLSNPLDNPGSFLTNTFAFFETNIIALLIIIFLAALWLGRG